MVEMILCTRIWRGESPPICEMTLNSQA